MLQPAPGHLGCLCVRLICCVGLLLTLPPVLLARSSSENSDYLVDVWTAGLPNSSVTSIAQTPDGYLWVGTYNGLARFDGARFVKFDPEHTPELLHPRIRKLFLDAQGTLWINTYEGSLTSWRDGKFTLEWRSPEYADFDVSRVAFKADHLSFLLGTGDLIRRGVEGTNRQWQVIEPPAKGLGTVACEDGAGTVWYRGRDMKLYRLPAGEAQFELVSTKLSFPDDVRARAISIDAQGRAWVASDRTIMMWNGERFTDMTPTNAEPMADATFLFNTRDGGVWAVANEKLRKFHGREWIEDSDPWQESLSGTAVMRMGAHEQTDGTVWFYQYGLGLVYVRPDGESHRFTGAEGFPGGRVDGFFEDAEGNLWAGVNRGGLVRLRKKQFDVVSRTRGARPVAMLSVCEDASGAVWLGTSEGGLVRREHGALEEFTVPGAGNGLVFSAYPGRNNELWLSVGDEDLYVMKERRLERCVPFVHGVKVILASRDGQTIWVGRKTGLSVCTNSSTRAFALVPGFPRTADVRALAEGADGVLWAAGGDGNLYRVTSNAVETLRPPMGSEAYPIWSLLLDDDGTVWAGTFRGGLLRYRNGQFKRFTVADGLSDNVVAQLLADDKGNLWIGSHQGIFRVARGELEAYAKGQRSFVESTAYGRLDGLPALECSDSYQPACWRARDGRLWFTTLGGAVSIQPDDPSSNLRPPPVVIEELLIDGVAQDLKSARQEPALGGLKENGKRRLWPAVIVPPGKRQFEFRFTGLSFISPDKVRFRYKLDNLDEKWVEGGTQRSVKYSFLRPGDYQFQVTACNNEGVWNTVGTGLILHVKPHFYETKTFIVAMILGGIGMTLLVARGIYRRRLRAELERVERQRAVERDRARIAKDIHDDLGAGLTQITLLSELAKRDTPEEVGEHVGQISGTARELTRAMDEIVWAINPQNDTLEGLVTYVSKFAQQYLTVAGIRCRLDVPTNLPACILGAEVRHNLYLAIKEALNNIVKHSGATLASLKLECVHGDIVLTLEDNGRGLTRTGSNGADNLRASSGHGLGNIARRLEDIGGRCEVSSEPGKGTRVQFTIHVPAAGSPVLATGPARGEN